MTTDNTVRGFTDALASAAPTPGGGAAAGVVGALAAALAAMVCNFTIGRKKFQAVDAEMRAVLARADAIRNEMIDLADADARAYDGVVAALALPKEPSDASAERERRLAAAVAEAIRVPLRTAVLAADVLLLAEPIAERGNPRLASDAGVAAILAEAALQAAGLNVRANYGLLTDGRARDDAEAALAHLTSQSRGTRERVLRLVEKAAG